MNDSDVCIICIDEMQTLKIKTNLYCVIPESDTQLLKV